MESWKVSYRDWGKLRAQFPVVRNYTYFNHAAIAPLSLSVKKQIEICNNKYSEQGIVSNREFLEKANETRELAAELINAKSSEICFIKNTTQGIQIAANGIKWQKGDNVLIPENDFPANVFPWMNLAKRGVETRFIPLKNGRYTAKDIAELIDNRTKAISVSAVSYSNGFRCNLEEIGKLCKNKGIYFIVDAIQALGAVKVDVRKAEVDLLSADAHKWLLGPQGIGFAFVSEKMLEQLDVSNMGYTCMTDEGDYSNYTIRLKPDASRFEEGTLNLMGIVGLHASLEMLLSIGIERIEKRILALNRLLAEKLVQKGYSLRSPGDCNELSGILSFNHTDYSTDQIFRELFEADVVCAKRDGAIRLSPHFYNNEEEIIRCVDALQS